MDEAISARLLDQRLRNRMIEAVDTLAMGDAGVTSVGAHEFFEGFYDFIPHREDAPQRPEFALAENSALTPEERISLQQVSALLDDACDATPKKLTDLQLIESGWPKRIQAVAESTLKLMLDRGRFSEIEEQAEPASAGR